MKKYSIKSIADFKQAFGKILHNFGVNSESYMKMVQKILQDGHEFQVTISEPWKAFHVKEKQDQSYYAKEKRYQYVIHYNGKRIKFGSPTVRKCLTTKEHIEKDPACYAKIGKEAVGKQIVNSKKELDLFEAECYYMPLVKWETLAILMSKMVKATIKIKNEGKCSKCKGKGRISAFSHVNNGICFECYGLGYKLNKNKKTEA